MIKFSTKTIITAAALMFSAVQSYASETCAADVNTCTPKQLCEASTSMLNNNKVWSVDPTYVEHVAMSKQLGINCGVVVVVEPTCETDAKLCAVSALCEQATVTSGSAKAWSEAAGKAGHVSLAKEYGLDCRVKAVAKQLNAADYEGQFKKQSLLRRKQIQYALKNLGYYSSSIDGSWGKGTSSGISNYVNASNIGSDSPSSVFIGILSKVEVPSSFDKPKAAVKQINSNNSKTSGLGNNLYLCERKSLSADGFTNQAAAMSWFPEELYIILPSNNEDWMSTTYGVAKNRSKSAIKNNIGSFRDSGMNVVVSGNKLTKEGGKVFVNLQNQGYKPTIPSHYLCGKATKTDRQR
jgi:peptidoglycan hydrolase-like protein with peptidoglycan-binding domain